MSVYDSNALADYDVAEDGEEGEDGREGRLAVNDPERDVVDFEAVGQVSNAFSTIVRMCDDDDFVSTIDKFLPVLGKYRVKAPSRLTLDNWYM